MRRAFFGGIERGWGWRRRQRQGNQDSQTLNDIAPGTDITIHRLYGHGPVRQRLLDLGFQPGRIITVLRNAPLRDPIEVQVGDTFIALRRKEAAHVEVSEQAIETEASDE